MTAFDQLPNPRRRLSVAGGLDGDPLIHRLLAETPAPALPVRFSLEEGIMVCQNGGRLPALGDQPGQRLNNAIFGLFGGGALIDADRNRFTDEIQRVWRQFPPNADINARGRAFAEALTELLAGNGSPQRRFHVTYVPADNNGPSRIEFRRAAIGEALGQPIYLFNQSERGTDTGLALARIRRTSNQDLTSQDWQTVISHFNTEGGTGADRQARLQRFIDEQINPFLHWSRQQGQDHGWHVRLVNAGPPTEIQLQQWNPSLNRVLAQGDAGFQALAPVTFPVAAPPGDNNPQAPVVPGGPPQNPFGVPDQAIQDALFYLRMGVYGMLSIYGIRHLAVPAASAGYNFLRNRRLDAAAIGNNNMQAQLAEAQTEAIRSRSAREAQRAAERIPPQRIEVELAEGVRVTLTPEQFARRVEQLRERARTQEIRILDGEITELERQTREEPNHADNASRQERLRRLQEQRTFLRERQPSECVEVTASQAVGSE